MYYCNNTFNLLCEKHKSIDPVYTIQLVVEPVEQLAALCKQTLNQFHNWLNVCLHDAGGCSIGCSNILNLLNQLFNRLNVCIHDITSWTTSCIM